MTVTAAVLPKNPRYETYKDSAGEFRWRFRAKNGLIMADSSEGCAKKGNAIRAAEEFRRANRQENPVPIVHWEAGEKDVGGRPKKVRP